MYQRKASRKSVSWKAGSSLPWNSSGPCRRSSAPGVVVLLLLLVAGCGGGGQEPSSEPGSIQEGKASYYAHKFHGRPTASGEIYDENALTAAHRTLKFGTTVRVTNLNNGKKVVVVVNDRGPFVEGRIIDLSWKAAGDLDMIAAGVVPVRVEVLRTSGDF
jgi:rare lipoprotein A